jgi:hypothetical protein
MSCFCVIISYKSGEMLDNVSATTIAGRELGAMSTAMKSNLVATLDKSLNTSVNKVHVIHMCSPLLSVLIQSIC